MFDAVSFALARKIIRHKKTIDDHDDVALISPSEGEVLTYEAATALWKNKAVPLKLSALEIDVDKDWAGKSIRNLNWLAPSYIGPYRDTGTAIYFRTRDIAGTTKLTHSFLPQDDLYGDLGDNYHRWLRIWVNLLYFNGGNLNPGYTLWVGGGAVDSKIEPPDDGYSYLGETEHRFRLVRAVTVTAGDLAFEERHCLVCGKKFREGDSVVLKVLKVEDEECQMRTVPVHAECNPHPIKPEMLKKHMEMLKPNRGNLSQELKPKKFEEDPLEEGEFEVLTVTVFDEKTATFTIKMWDETIISIPLPPDADEKLLIEKACEYYKLIKERMENEKQAKERGEAKLKRKWTGVKLKIPRVKEIA
jgi:hypothetical protein